MSMKSKIRPRPKHATTTAATKSSMVVVLVVVALLMTMTTTTTTTSAWQQPVLPQNNNKNNNNINIVKHARGMSTSTARQYAVETEIVAATAATTQPPPNVMVMTPHGRRRRRRLVRRVVRKMSVTQHAQSSSSSSSSSIFKQQQQHLQKPREKMTLLSRDEEVLYAYQIRTLRAAIRQRDELQKSAQENNNNTTTTTTTMVSEQEWAAACGTTVRQLRTWLQHGRQAREVLVAANVGLVTNIAKKHYYGHLHKTACGGSMSGSGGGGSILTLHDLLQEGNLGLLKAAERFEPERGFRFSTYAVYWIRQRVLRAIHDSARVIRLPAHVHATLTKMNRARVHFQCQHGRDPTVTELAAVCDMSTAKLVKLQQAAQAVLSLQAPVLANKARSHEDTRTIGDAIKSSAPTPVEACESAMLQADVANVLSTMLTAQERTVVAHRYGLTEGNRDQALTVAATARAMDMSPDAVRAAEARALNKLRHGGHHLQGYVNNGKVTTMASGIRSSSSSSTSNHSPFVTTKKKIWESADWNDSTTTTMATKLAPRAARIPITKRKTARVEKVEGSRDRAVKQDRLWFF